MSDDPPLNRTPEGPALPDVVEATLPESRASEALVSLPETAATESVSLTSLPDYPLLRSLEPERDPFWGYLDLAIFLVLAVPCMLAGAVLGLWAVKVAGALFPFQRDIPAMEPLVEQLGGDAILFTVLALILRLQHDRPFWRSLGWRPFRIPFLWVVICGLASAIGVALLGSLVKIPEANPMVDLMKDHWSAILMACFGVTIAPVTEELVFRGFLQPLLVRSLGAVAGILLAALPFGLLHYHEYGNSWRHALLISLAGVGFGWMRHHSGSTAASSLMHASYNGLIFFAVFK